MRHDISIRLPIVAVLVLLLTFQPVIAADPKADKADTQQSTAITAEQLEQALTPITAELQGLRAENARLGQLIATADNSEPISSDFESDLMTIRIALFAMSLGMIGGLIKLRSLVRQSKN